jgi:hypothetical protein
MRQQPSAHILADAQPGERRFARTSKISKSERRELVLCGETRGDCGDGLRNRFETQRRSPSDEKGPGALELAILMIVSCADAKSVSGSR